MRIVGGGESFTQNIFLFYEQSIHKNKSVAKDK